MSASHIKSVSSHTHMCQTEGCSHFEKPSVAACGCHKTHREMLESACAHMEAALFHFFARDKDKPTNWQHPRPEAERLAVSELRNIGIRNLNDVDVYRAALEDIRDCAMSGSFFEELAIKAIGPASPQVKKEPPDIEKLRDAIRWAVECLDADDTIGAHEKLCAVLDGFE